MTDLKFTVSLGSTIVVGICVIASLVVTLLPAGSQNQALFGVVLATSIITGIVGWFLAYVLFKGNPDAQLKFILFFTFVLFTTSSISAIVSAFQLYGLRESIATKVQQTTLTPA